MESLNEVIYILFLLIYIVCFWNCSCYLLLLIDTHVQNLGMIGVVVTAFDKNCNNQLIT